MEATSAVPGRSRKRQRRENDKNEMLQQQPPLEQQHECQLQRHRRGRCGRTRTTARRIPVMTSTTAAAALMIAVVSLTCAASAATTLLPPYQQLPEGTEKNTFEYQHNQQYHQHRHNNGLRGRREREEGETPFAGTTSTFVSSLKMSDYFHGGSSSSSSSRSLNEDEKRIRAVQPPQPQHRYVMSTSEAEPSHEGGEEENGHSNSNSTHGGDGHSYFDTTMDVVHVGNSRQFQIVFGTFLGLIFVVRSCVCWLLIKYRKHGNLRLTQPTVLTVLVMCGSISIMSCFFLIHNHTTQRFQIDNILCLLRDPFILAPLTIAGNILLSRVWRISLLLSPIWDVGTNGGAGRGGMTSLHDADGQSQPFGERAKRFILYYLTRIADVYGWVVVLCSKGRNARRSNHNKKWKKTVPLEQLFLLTFLLTLPQLVLQIVNLAVPAFQEELVPLYNEYGDVFVEVRHLCKADVGHWPTFVGVALTIIPYILTAIVSWYSVDDLPDVFNEAVAYTQSIKVIALVAAICIPPLCFDSQDNSPDTSVYLVSMLVFAAAMPPCWFLVYPRLKQVMMDPDVEVRSNHIVKHLLRKKTQKPTVISKSNREDHSKSTKLALTIGKMYEEMGMAQKSIDLFDEAIAVWQSDPNRSNKEKIGGFTMDEINSFSVIDLDNVINLLVAKGRVNGTYHVADSSGQKHAAHAWLDALEVFEKAPARLQMDDSSRKTLFPVFSGVWVFILGGKIEAHSNLEVNIARTFVRESKLNGDPIHYMRALAMIADVEANRKGTGTKKYIKALENFEKIKDIYDVREHHADVCSEYGTDRAAQSFSKSTLWLPQLGDKQQRIDETCNHVLDQLIPFMDPENVLNSFEMLLPIIYTHKLRGETKIVERALETYVMKNYHTYFESKGKFTPCAEVLKPMSTLLSLCSDPDNFPNIEDAVEWMVQDNSGVPSDFLDNIYMKMCWSMLSLTAEVCLRLAERLIKTNGAMNDVRVLVEKGLKLAKQAEKKLTNKKGHVVYPIAYAIHGPVYCELKEVAQRLGITTNHMNDSIQTINTRSSNSNSSSAIDPQNLPPSYFNNLNGSSAGSLGSGSGAVSADGSNNPLRPSSVMIARFESNAESKGSSDSVCSDDGMTEESLNFSKLRSVSMLESPDEALENSPEEEPDVNSDDVAGTETTSGSSRN
eukprot:CAMPEP_0113477568 /NCGR_PEP_ID=MMETSP0014_2-20120614/20275_1 /TAXON_ID=2857 /ORGANISM="Nitzschia sp." /LENGTH=1168 /DNA_ID=CAMNT_0000370667 /DNA_START=246 /DNA_END=3755 /DNA_ORIENTATION=- /assembly_acc=CAM_ASM_000159